MKRITLFLWLNLYPTITLLAEKSYPGGRDYALREDSPFISPIELIGGAALIVGGYWALRGIFSGLSHLRNKNIFLIIIAVIGVGTILFIDSQPRSYQGSQKVEQEIRRQLLEQETRQQVIEETHQQTYENKNEQVDNQAYEMEQKESVQTIDFRQIKQQAYFIGFQQGYYDGVNDGYNESTMSGGLGILPLTGKGKSYNNSCNYDDYDLINSYTNGYENGYSNGLQVGLNQRLDEYKRKQIELKQNEWDDGYLDKLDVTGLKDKEYW